MRVKFGQLHAALEYLRNETRLRDAPATEVEISVREEDPGKGVIGDSIILNVTTVTKPSSYDNYKSETTTEYTVEVFPASENRPPRVVGLSTRDLT